MSFGENVRKRRLDMSMQQNELAMKVNVSAPMIAMIERGSKSASLGLSIEIAKALDCTLDELIKAS